MRIKNIFTAGLFFLTINLVGQDNNQYPKKEIGFDATAFFELFFNSNDGFSTPNSLYFISYRRNLSENIFLRVGTGIRLNNNKETGGRNSNTDFENKSSRIDLRVGIERQKNIGNKWEYYYGADLFIGSYKFKKTILRVDFSQPDEVTKSLNYGMGPILGLRYKINSSLVLGTESSIYFDRANTKRDYEYQDPLRADNDGEIITSMILFNPPTLLYILIRF